MLHVCHLHRHFRVEERERRKRSSVVDVLASGLQETTDEEDLKQGVCILEELELTTSCD